MSSAAVWQLHQNSAQLCAIHRRASVQLDQPADGVKGIGDERNSLISGRLFGVEVDGTADAPTPIAVIDRYVRQNDLVATYESSASTNLRAQVYWRYRWEESGGESQVGGRGDGIHLITSLQTDCLDLQPKLRLVSELPVVELLTLATPDSQQLTRILDREGAAQSQVTRSESPLWLVRVPDDVCSVVLMTMPDDLARTKITVGDPYWRLEFQLLGGHLEKGVIRRAQAAAWFVPRVGDDFWARRLFWQFNASPPPLTT